jgi:hypothetical protein
VPSKTIEETLMPTSVHEDGLKTDCTNDIALEVKGYGDEGVPEFKRESTMEIIRNRSAMSCDHKCNLYIVDKYGLHLIAH